MGDKPEKTTGQWTDPVDSKKRLPWWLVYSVIIIGGLVIAGALLNPFSGSYMATALVNASKENHNRVRDFVAVSFEKCADGSAYITLKSSAAETSNYNCTMSAGEISQPMINHFSWDDILNPHNTAEVAVWSNSSTTPPLGRTHINPVDNALRIITNVGTKSGDNKYLEHTVTKE